MNPILRGVLIFLGLLVVLACIGGVFLYQGMQDYQDRAVATEATGTLSALTMDVEHYVVDHCELPSDLPKTGDPADCCGGEQCQMDADAAAEWEASELGTARSMVREALPAYFTYEAVKVDSSTYELRAEADFDCESPNHTVTKRIMLEGCDAVAEPETVENEFQ